MVLKQIISEASQMEIKESEETQSKIISLKSIEKIFEGCA
jgi:hypothetical protein